MASLTQDRAKTYSSIKYSLAIADTFYLLLLLFLFQALGFSQKLVFGLSSSLLPGYLVVPAYILIGYLVYYFLNFPLCFYQSYLLERQFSLSKQKIKDWLFDQLKAGMVSYTIVLILAAAFYYILGRFPVNWWWVVSLFWIFFSLVLAKLTPILIIPLFFKYKRLSDEELRRRIINLARKVEVKILDVFEIDFSKKTLKANAAFVGLGKSRRVLLADTLKDKYSHDEIEVILAHEFAHFKLKHLIKLMLVNSLATLSLFYLIYQTSSYPLSFFRLSSLSDPASLPLLLIYFLLFGVFTQPLENYISRKFERNADTLALSLTGFKEPFISMMEKLAQQNLADRNPAPIVKFFFFSHPPIDERIALAQSFKNSDSK